MRRRGLDANCSRRDDPIHRHLGRTDMSRSATRGRDVVAAAALALLAGVVGGCAYQSPVPPAKPSVAPTSQPTASLQIGNGSEVGPMYRELMAVDLETVVRVAMADSLDIRQARERVE